MKSKTPINLIYSADLFRELMPHPRVLTTKKNICLKMTRPNMMVAYINLNTDESKGYKATLRTDEITLDNFIEEHKVTDLGKLDNIDLGILWIKYLAGKAEVRVEMPDMDLKKIQFRVVDGCTMAYNYDRHFCDRIPQVLSMLPHFESYLKLNRNRLENINALRSFG
ncbi:hypothetical protein [Pedobacter heparinus]|uniref:hypothetical protein n=1 Tax=Pedobacter heparinus TaxID=984 RepID=UPI002931A136|nr:hypothetical protein [Pedobacter heparinus]